MCRRVAACRWHRCDSLKKFAAHKNLLGLDIAQFNPDKDADGSAAKKIVELLVEALSARLAAADSLDQPETPAVPAHTATTQPEAPRHEAPQPEVAHEESAAAFAAEPEEPVSTEAQSVEHESESAPESDATGEPA